MKRDQTIHEELIPLLVDRLGVRRYLEFGCHENETVGPVLRRCGTQLAIHAVDIKEPGERLSYVNYHIMRTDEFIRLYAVQYSPFDMVFVDADHSASSVIRDIDGIWPYVADEGLVLMHDTNPATVADTEPGFCGDSWKAAMELTKRGMECVTLPYHPGLTIIRKRCAWGPK